MAYDHINNDADEARDLRDAMALLSPAERAAIADDTDSELDALNQAQDNGSTEPRPVDQLPEPTESTGKNNDVADEDDEDDPVVEVPPVETPASATPDAIEPQAEAPAVAPEPAPAPAAPVQEVGYQVPAVEGYDEKMAALGAERAEAMAKLLDGELTAAEYAAVDARTLSEREALTSQQNRHQIAVEMEEQRARNEWNKTVAAIRKGAIDEGLDYTPGTVQAKSWDRWVRFLGADPENNHQPGDWFLKEAHRLNSMQYNPQKSVPNVETAPPAVNKPAPNRAPDLSNIPPTLGSAPAASAVSEGEDGGEFAHLANLKGIVLERALARMTPEQADRYLES